MDLNETQARMSKNPRPTIAIFGGSFDPPHAAHALVPAYVRSVSDVDSVLVIPAFQHPLGKDTQTPFEHRLRMCELAMQHLVAVEVSPLERDLGGVSRTLRTLEEVARRRPEARLRLVIGADILGGVDRWHRWDLIEEMAPPIVIGRRGYPPPTGCKVELPEMSSTEVRRRLGAGEDTEGMLSHLVRDYIDEHRLYGADP